MKEAKDEIENQIVEVTEKRSETKQKKAFTIMGITIGRLLAYFIVYSILGYVVETLFGLVTKGVIESRKSFLYGPFCGIYGIGAIIMIPTLKKFDKNNFTLFIGGFFIGSIVEYVISLIGESVFHIKWWDYSDMAFNIQGRICIAFSFFWGILGIFLMTYVNPKVDRLIDKIPNNYLKPIVIIGIVFLILNAIITGIAIKVFFTRLVRDYDLEINSDLIYSEKDDKIYDHTEVQKITDWLFSNEKMIQTFPNIKINSKNGDIIHIKDVLHEIQPYYVRLFTPRTVGERQEK